MWFARVVSPMKRVDEAVEILGVEIKRKELRAGRFERARLRPRRNSLSVILSEAESKDLLFA